jgi:hypothetical protein
MPTLEACAKRVMNNKLLGPDHIELADKGVLQLDEVVDLLDCREFEPRVVDLLDVVHLHKVAWCG